MTCTTHHDACECRQAAYVKKIKDLHAFADNLGFQRDAYKGREAQAGKLMKAGAAEMVRLAKRVEVLEAALHRIIDNLCGPPKMSETVGTIQQRLAAIKVVASEALGGPIEMKP